MSSIIRGRYTHCVKTGFLESRVGRLLHVVVNEQSLNPHARRDNTSHIRHGRSQRRRRAKERTAVGSAGSLTQSRFLIISEYLRITVLFRLMTFTLAAADAAPRFPQPATETEEDRRSPSNLTTVRNRSVSRQHTYHS